MNKFDVDQGYPYVRIDGGFWLVKYCEKRSNIDTDFHYHYDPELYFLIEGSCRFLIDENIYDVNAGDLVIIPPNVLHKAIYKNSEGITRYVMNCEGSFLSEKSNEIFASLGYVHCFKGAVEELEKIFRKIKKEYDRQDEMSVEFVKSYLTVIAAMVFRNPESKNKVEVEVNSRSKFVENAIDFLKKNYTYSISLEDIAKHVSVSYIHLSRTFKRETGLGVNEFLNLYRLRQARFVLSECPEKSISDVAYDCGFNDSNYFAVRIKKVFGITPSQFRNGGVIVNKQLILSD